MEQGKNELDFRRLDDARCRPVDATRIGRGPRDASERLRPTLSIKCHGLTSGNSQQHSLASSLAVCQCCYHPLPEVLSCFGVTYINDRSGILESLYCIVCSVGHGMAWHHLAKRRPSLWCGNATPPASKKRTLGMEWPESDLICNIGRSPHEVTLHSVLNPSRSQRGLGNHDIV